MIDTGGSAGMEVHPATLWEALSDALGDRAAVVQGDRRISWREFEDRSARLAAVLQAGGVTAGSKVGLLLHNSPEYLEGYFAAIKLRAVPFNINWRYTSHEVGYLLENADADALIFHAGHGDVVVGAAAAAGRPDLLIEVDDGAATGRAPVPRALHYEDAIAEVEPAARIERSPDDVAMTYTGGTTGMPKGVVASARSRARRPARHRAPAGRHAAGPHRRGARGGRRARRVGRSRYRPRRSCTGPGSASGPSQPWPPAARSCSSPAAASTPPSCGTPSSASGPTPSPSSATRSPGRCSPRCEARPGRDLSSVRIISSAGAMFSAELKAAILEHLPQALVMDIIAATEGAMGTSFTSATSPVGTGRFHPGPGVIVIADDDRLVEPGSGEIGMVAVPGGAEGYYKDDEKTDATFRVIDGTRYAIPGDCATVDADGLFTLLGRGSSCINTAGEKVYPEEVEEALKTHPAIEDALVFGVDDERFGQQVAAVVSRSNGTGVPIAEVLAALHERLASYKIPRSVVVVDEVPRTQVGKADYPTARSRFAAGPVEPG